MNEIAEMRQSPRVSQPWLTTISISLIVVGLVLFGLVAFYLYSDARSGSDVGRFEVKAAPSDLPELLAHSAPVEPVRDSTVQPAGAAQPDNGAAREDDSVKTVDGPTGGDTPVPDVLDLASVYPASLTNPKYWAEPYWAGAAPFGGPSLPVGFEPVSSRDMNVAEAAGSVAFRIRIPAVNLDSSVAELGLVNIEDQLSYETPDNTVGHIPDTAHPGEMAQGWYFGHLRSVLQGEGNVFGRLPDIPGLIRQDPVDVVLVTEDAEYLYRVVATEQLHQDDLAITDTPNSSIILVTCWPPNVYDRRILVHAELIAVKRA